MQLPGRENRFVEAPFTRAEAVVEAMAPAAGPVLDRPYALFGHSMGAMLGFELIRHLRRRGDPLPVQFFVSASAPRSAPAGVADSRPTGGRVRGAAAGAAGDTG